MVPPLFKLAVVTATAWYCLRRHSSATPGFSSEICDLTYFLDSSRLVIIYVQPCTTMALNNTPIYVFVPGAWHTPDTFDGIRALLSKRRHDSEAIALPSVGAAEPTKSGLHDDIAHTNGVLRAMAEQGRQIVVVTHSYGGMVGAGAVEGLGYAQRSKAGQPGGVIMMVWLAAFVTPKGKSVIDMLGGNWLPWMLLSVCICCYSGLSSHLFHCRD